MYSGKRSARPTRSSHWSSPVIVQTLKDNVDERFLTHRLRATSLAGIAGGLTASFLFLYYYFATDAPRWDLLAVALVIAAVKMGALAYLRMTD